MPVKISKTKSGKFSVRTPHGVKAKGTTLKKAKAQARLLRGVEHGWKPTGKKSKNEESMQKTINLSAAQLVAHAINEAGENLGIELGPEAGLSGHEVQGIPEPGVHEPGVHEPGVHEEPGSEPREVAIAYDILSSLDRLEAEHVGGIGPEAESIRELANELITMHGAGAGEPGEGAPEGEIPEVPEEEEEEEEEDERPPQ